MVSITQMAKTRIRRLLKVAGLTTMTLAALIAFGSRADAQSVPLTGKIVSASSLTGTNVFTTPQSGAKFVLTQWCVELNQAVIMGGNAILTGSSFGFIAEIQGLYDNPGNPGKAACVSFSPGYVMPLKETLSCAEQSLEYNGAVTCSISGVFSPTLP